MERFATTDEIIERERDVTAEVWFITPVITHGPRRFREVMRHNLLQRNIKYCGIVGDNPATQESLAEFVAGLELDGEAVDLRVRIAPQDAIESDVSLFDPNGPGESGWLLAPIELSECHVPILGPALYRLKDRFKGLWRLSDPWSLDAIGGSSGELPRGFVRAAWLAAQGLRLRTWVDRWEDLGLTLYGSQEVGGPLDARRGLLERLLERCAADPSFSPPFGDIAYPAAISGPARLMAREVVRAHLCGASSATLGMCGKLLELSLRHEVEARLGELAPGARVGLGELIGKIRPEFGKGLDEGLGYLVNFINESRNIGVHARRNLEIPTPEQARGVVAITYDTLRKLFGP